MDDFYCLLDEKDLIASKGYNEIYVILFKSNIHLAEILSILIS